MSGNGTEKRFEVVVTGWMQDETFEDNVRVEAASEDEAVTKALAKMTSYWGHAIEVGDVAVYGVAS